MTEHEYSDEDIEQALGEATRQGIIEVKGVDNDGRIVYGKPPLTCPTSLFAEDGEKHTIIGCGSTNVYGPDDEGLYDCLNCGIWFKPEVVGSAEERHAVLDNSPKARLEYLRRVLRTEHMSYGELAELQSLAGHIEPGDVELLEAAGVPEFPDENDDTAPLARNNVEGVPVIIEHPERFPFNEGERERDWHEATDDEYAAYVKYWNEKFDAEAAT